MNREPGLFAQYHTGFQHQTQAWPVKPVQVAVDWLATLPDSLVVADFGCGDAELARSVKQVRGGGACCVKQCGGVQCSVK